jgi:hypothetical protein
MKGTTLITEDQTNLMTLGVLRQGMFVACDEVKKIGGY